MIASSGKAGGALRPILALDDHADADLVTGTIDPAVRETETAVNPFAAPWVGSSLTPPTSKRDVLSSRSRAADGQKRLVAAAGDQGTATAPFALQILERARLA